MCSTKKLMAIVSIGLALILSGCGNNADLQSQLDSANSRIFELEAEIAQKDSTITNLNTQIDTLTSKTTNSVDSTASDSSYVDNEEQLGMSNIINFSGLQIEFTQDVKVETVDNQFSEYNGTKAIGIPVTITNTSDDTNYLNMFYVKMFGSKGTETDRLNSFFNDGDAVFSKLRSGASIDGYFYIPYDGDGDYYISFDNIVNDPIEQLIHIELG